MISIAAAGCYVLHQGTIYQLRDTDLTQNTGTNLNQFTTRHGDAKLSSGNTGLGNSQSVPATRGCTTSTSYTGYEAGRAAAEMHRGKGANQNGNAGSNLNRNGGSNLNQSGQPNPGQNGGGGAGPNQNGKTGAGSTGAGSADTATVTGSTGGSGAGSTGSGSNGGSGPAPPDPGLPAPEAAPAGASKPHGLQNRPDGRSQPARSVLFTLGGRPATRAVLRRAPAVAAAPVFSSRSRSPLVGPLAGRRSRRLTFQRPPRSPTPPDEAGNTRW